MASEVIRLVIDTSIPHGATEKDNPLAARCRDVLMAVLNPEGIYKAVMSADLRREWDDRSDPKKRWRVQWLARLESAGKIIPLEYAEYVDHGFRTLVRDYDTKHAIVNPDSKCEKDVHLVEAAWVTDLRVISEEHRIVKHLKVIAIAETRVGEIVWLHPEKDKAIDWLKADAPMDENRKLGYQP